MLIAIATRYFPQPEEPSLAGVDPRDPEQVTTRQTVQLLPIVLICAGS